LFDLLILMEIMIHVITVHELILKNNKILVHARKLGIWVLQQYFCYVEMVGSIGCGNRSTNRPVEYHRQTYIFNFVWSTSINIPLQCMSFALVFK
jgi:hypothetical protein